MYGFWQGLKRFGKWCVISSICWWVLAWALGSWQAGRVIGPGELMPTADKWMTAWR